jgi:hypothetical protein
MGSFV